jgi:hypothetical protein
MPMAACTTRNDSPSDGRLSLNNHSPSDGRLSLNNLWCQFNGLNELNGTDEWGMGNEWFQIGYNQLESAPIGKRHFNRPSEAALDFAQRLTRTIW